MGWRRRTRSRPTRCSRQAYQRAHDRGIGPFAAYLKVCGPPAGIKGAVRRARRK